MTSSSSCPTPSELKVEIAHLRQRLYDAELTADRAMTLLATSDEQHRELEKQVRRSRTELQFVNDTIYQLVWRSQDQGVWTSASPQWTAYTGQSEEQSVGLGWLEIVHPDDRERTMAAWQSAKAKGTLKVDHRLRRAADSSYRWFQTRATPFRDVSGRIIEWFGTSTDVHELRALQRRQGLLITELQQQARNTLALVRVLAQGLAKTNQSVDGYAGQLDDRLTAYSRVLGAMTRDPELGVNLESLVAEELVAQLGRSDDQVDLSGPTILLSPQIAAMLGLAIYELSSNAVEHGALTKPNGRVRIAWWHKAYDAGIGLMIEWAETNLFGHISQPKRRGSGINFLEQALADRLKANVVLTFAPPGLRCTIHLPLHDPVAWGLP